MFRILLSQRSAYLTRNPWKMSATPVQTYATAAGGHRTHTPSEPDRGRTHHQKNNNQQRSSSNTIDPSSIEKQEERSAQESPKPSPHHKPNTSSPEETTYVLTLATDSKHHHAMTDLRNKYFPKHLNKLSAHITLFHTLPGSKLEEEIIPVLQETASSTPAFHILAATPFKLNNGIAIGVPKTAGGDQARSIHAILKQKWTKFLSAQDRTGGFAAHYTIMNKVSDRDVVEKSFSEVKNDFRAVHGNVTGLSLHRYHKGGWEWVRTFEFEGQKT